MFNRLAGMSREEFMNYRRNVHAPLLLAIPEARYIKKFVVSYPVTPPDHLYGAPGYDALVEAWFDNIEEMNRLFQSENFLTKVDPDHENFIDLSSIKRIVADEITVIGF